MSTIIVGGGIVGGAVAYFLAERREPDVTLLERAVLGAGSSKGGLGGIRHQFTDELDVSMSKVASAFWRSYDDLTRVRSALPAARGRDPLRHAKRHSRREDREGSIVATGCVSRRLPAAGRPARTRAVVRERAAWRHPAFANVQIRSSWSCYYEMTPDDHPIVGAIPGVQGLYIAAGFSGHGCMHAPATARLIVEEMLDGRATTLDIGDLSLERFQTGRRPFAATIL